VGSNVNLDDKFSACGTVSLRYTNVGGSLRIGFAAAKDTSGTPMKTPLDATGAQIAQELDWKPVGPDTGAVNLEQTTVGRLVDSWANGRVNGYWPTKGQLRLDGLSYGRICHLHDANKYDAKIRLEWIRSQYQDAAPDNPVRFATQPYEQLASIYLQGGRDADARRVAIARRQDLREYGKISNSLRFGNWLLDVTIKYGYRTWRAAIYLAVVYLLVVLFFSFAGHHDAVIPTQAPGGQPAATSVAATSITARQCTGDYPCFNPWGYAIDTVIPIINVHQADYWSPDATVPWGRAAVWVTYLGTAIGWLLSALAVAGYTGLVRSSGAP
jgi:hypothetical protein